MYILLKFIMTAVRDNIADMGITSFIYLFIFYIFYTVFDRLHSFTVMIKLTNAQNGDVL